MNSQTKMTRHVTSNASNQTVTSASFTLRTHIQDSTHAHTLHATHAFIHRQRHICGLSGLSLGLSRLRLRDRSERMTMERDDTTTVAWIKFTKCSLRTTAYLPCASTYK